MARYGRDFTDGRYMRRNRGDIGIGYDADHGWGAGRRGGEPSGRGHGGEPREHGREWGGNRRPNSLGGLDESWASSAHGRGRMAYDRDWTARDRPRPGAYGSRNLNPYPAGFGGGRGFYDRQMTETGRRGDQGYGMDVGDRIRHGWNRFRDEASDLMGRGYDRGW